MDKKMIDRETFDKLMGMLILGTKEEKEYARKELKRLGLLQERKENTIEIKKEEAILRFLKEGIFWKKEVNEDLETIDITVDGKVLKGETKHILLSLLSRVGWYYLTGESIPKGERDMWYVPYEGTKSLMKKGVVIRELKYTKSEEEIIEEMERIFSKIQSRKKELAEKRIVHKGLFDSFVATFNPIVTCFTKKFLNIPGDEEKERWYESEGIQIIMEVGYGVEIEFASWVCQEAVKEIVKILEKNCLKVIVIN